MLGKRRYTRGDIQQIVDTGTRPAPVFRVGQTAYGRPSEGPVAPPAPGSSRDILARYRIWMRSPKYVEIPGGERIFVGGGGKGFFVPSLRSEDPATRNAAIKRMQDAYIRAIMPTLEARERAAGRAAIETIPGIGSQYVAFNQLQNLQESLRRDQERIAAGLDPIEVRQRYMEPIAPWAETISTFQAERLYGMQPGSSVFGVSRATPEAAIPLQPGETYKQRGMDTGETWLERPQLRRLDPGVIAAQLYANGLPDFARRYAPELPDLPSVKQLPSGMSRERLLVDAYQDAYEGYLESVQGWRDLLKSEDARDYARIYAKKRGINLGTGLSLEEYADLPRVAQAATPPDAEGRETRVPLSSLNVIKRVKENGKTYVYVKSPTTGVISKMEVRRVPRGGEVAIGSIYEDAVTFADIRNIGWSLLTDVIYGTPLETIPKNYVRGVYGPESDGEANWKILKDVSAWIASNTQPLPANAPGYRGRRGVPSGPSPAWANMEDWVDSALDTVNENVWDATRKAVDKFYKLPAENRTGLAQATFGQSELIAYVANILDRVVAGESGTSALFDAFRQAMGKPVILKTSDLPETHRQYAFGYDPQSAAEAIDNATGVGKDGRPTALTNSVRQMLEAQAIASTSGKLSSTEASRMTDTQLMDVAYTGNNEVEQILQNVGRNISEIPALPAGLFAVGQEVGRAYGGTRAEQEQALKTVLGPILNYWEAWAKAITWSSTAGQFGSYEDLKREAYNNPLWTGLSAVYGAGVAARMATIVGRAGFVSKMGRLGAAYNDLARTERVIANFPDVDPLSQQAAGRTPTGPDGTVRLEDLTPDEYDAYNYDYSAWEALPAEQRAVTPAPDPASYFNETADVARVLADAGFNLGYARPNIVSQIRKRLQKRLFESTSDIGKRYRDFLFANRGKTIVNDAQRVARALADERVQPLIDELNKLGRLDRARAVFDLTIATRFLIPERFGVESFGEITPAVIAQKLQENLDAGVIHVFDADTGTMVTREVTSQDAAKMEANIAFLMNLENANPSRANELFAEIRRVANLIEKDNILLVHAMGVGGDLIRRLDDISMMGARDAVAAFGAPALARVAAERAEITPELERLERVQREGVFVEAPSFQTAADYRRRVEQTDNAGVDTVVAAANDVLTADLADLAERLARGETSRAPGQAAFDVVNMEIPPVMLSPRDRRLPASKRPKLPDATRAAEILRQNIMFALAGIDQEAWYRHAGAWLRSTNMSPEETQLFAAVMAITSAQRSVFENIQDASAVWQRMQKARREGTGLTEQLSDLTWLNSSTVAKLQAVFDGGVDAWLGRGMRGRGAVEGGKYAKSTRSDVKTAQFYYAIMNAYDPEIAARIAEKYNITISGSTSDVHDVRSKVIDELPRNAKGGRKEVTSVEDRNQAEFTHEVNRLTLAFLRDYAERTNNVALKRILDKTNEDGIQAAVWTGARTAKQNGWNPGTPVTADIVRDSYTANAAPPKSATKVGTFEEGAGVERLALNLGVEVAPGGGSAAAYRGFWDALDETAKQGLSERGFVALAEALALAGVRADIGSTGVGVWDGVAAYSGLIRAFGQAFRSVEKITGLPAEGTTAIQFLEALAERGFAPKTLRRFVTDEPTAKKALDAIRIMLDAEMDPDVLDSVLPIVSAFGREFDQDSVAYSRILDSEFLRTKKLTRMANGVVFEMADGSRIQPGLVDELVKAVETALEEAKVEGMFVVYNHLDDSRGMLSILPQDRKGIKRRDIRDMFVDLDPRNINSIAAVLRLRGKGESPLFAIINDVLNNADGIGAGRGATHVRSNLIGREEYDARIRQGRPTVDRGAERPRDAAGAGNSAEVAAAQFADIRNAATEGRLPSGRAGESAGVGPTVRSRIGGEEGRLWWQADDDAGLNARGAIGLDARQLASGNYILALFRGQADASTLIHELVGHVIARDLAAVDPASLKTLEDYIGKAYNEWSYDDHERIARMAEEYFRTGRVPPDARKRGKASNVALGRAMRHIKEIISSIYHAVAYTIPGEARVTTRGRRVAKREGRLETDMVDENVRAVFDRYFAVPPNAKLRPLTGSKVRRNIRKAAIEAGIPEADVDAVLTVLDARAYAWAKLTKSRPSEWYSDTRGAGISRAIVREKATDISEATVARQIADMRTRLRILSEREALIYEAAEERMRRILRESPERSVLFAPTYGSSALTEAAGLAGVDTGRGRLGRRARRRSMEAIELGRFLLPARDSMDEYAYISSIIRSARTPTEVYEYLVAVMAAFKRDGILLNNPEAIRWARAEADANEWVAVEVDAFAGGKAVQTTRSEEIRRILGADADLTDDREFGRVANEIVKQYGFDELDENSAYILVPKSLFEGAKRQINLIEQGQGIITRATRAWQRIALTTLPRTPIANIVGSGILAATRGFSPEALRIAIKIARGTYGIEWPVEIRNMGLYGALLGPPDAIKNEAVRRLYWPLAAWMDLMHKGNVMGEDFARLVVFVQSVMEDVNRAEGMRALAGIRSMNQDANLLFDFVINGGDTAEANRIRARAMQSVEDWVGRYSRGGKVERFLSNLIPFNQWYRHMLRLYFLTMPFNYPGRSMVMSGLAQMGADYLREHGVWPDWYMDVFPLEELPIVAGEEVRDVYAPLSTGELGVVGQQRSVKGIRTQAINPFATPAMAAEPREALARSLNPYLTFLISAFTGRVAKPGAKDIFAPAIAGQDINGSPVYVNVGANSDYLKFLVRLVEDRAVPLGILREGGKFDTSITTLEAIRSAFGIDSDTKLYEGPGGATAEPSVAPSRAKFTPETLFLRFIGFSPVQTDAEGIANMSRTIKALQRRMQPQKEKVVGG